MTNQLSLRSLDIPQIARYGVGFDHMFDRLDEIFRINAQHQTNYPPYNIIKFSDERYAIEIAVAGFTQGEIAIEVKENQLTVEGKQTTTSVDEREYVHRGISGRDFVRVFTLAEHVEVIGAHQENGVLIVNLERRVPQEKKPKKISISYAN